MKPHYGSASSLVASLAFAAVLTMFANAADAAKFSTIYTFGNPPDADNPFGGVVADSDGNLFGMSEFGGTATCDGPGCGTFFELSVSGRKWTEKVLYSFTGQAGDGYSPLDGPIFVGNNLFGTTYDGGTDGGCVSLRGCGTVVELSQSGGVWKEAVLYKFKGKIDGGNPFGDLASDSVGNLYGITTFAGKYGQGTVFELSPAQNRRTSWTFKTLFAFNDGANDGGPYANGKLIIDAKGDIYGTTEYGGQARLGSVFKLSQNKNGKWREIEIYSFQGGTDGAQPENGVIFDAGGNLYGTTEYGGNYQCYAFYCGTVFELSPSNGKWKELILYRFNGGTTDGGNPAGALTFDGAGNLWGTALCCGTDRWGTVFKMTPSGGNWKETTVHNFTGGTDGTSPWAGLLYINSTLYGTASGGISDPGGAVFSITP